MPTSLEACLTLFDELAPLRYAAEWDNVGLLIEPLRARRIKRVFLTIDLTEPVLDEAIAAGAELILAYHPPIFAKLSRLTRATDKERIVLRTIEKGVAVYSPHTALDAVPGGVNDWLADAFGRSDRRALEPVDDQVPAAGQGRFLELVRPLGLSALRNKIKKHLGLRHVQVAPSPHHRGLGKIATIALCAGAGGSVITDVEADLYFTGEMRHHDVLAANARGTSVVLCGHTNTERGYLQGFAERLRQRWDSRVEVITSQIDADPLEIH